MTVGDYPNIVKCVNCKNTNTLNEEEYSDYKNGLLHCKYCLDFLKTSYLDKLMENKEFKEKLKKEYKLIKDLEDIIINTKRVIETANANQP